jgi:hypothetical protein
MKFMNQARKYGARVAVGASALVALPVLAASPYAAITTAVDWTDVETGVVAIAALIAAVLVFVKGSKMLLAMIGR